MTSEPGNKGPAASPATSESSRVRAFFEHLGRATRLSGDAARVLFSRGVDRRLFLYQMDRLGLKSLGIASATAVFVGIVMSIQFAFTLEKFGARDMVGRIIALSETRELAPALTALVVGCRIGAGIAAELGSMTVTQQIDAMRVLGADPIQKLVVPRILACMVTMPLLTCFALVLGVGSAMVVSSVSFGVSSEFFLSSAIGIVKMHDLLSGLGKTPFFGFLIGLLGCYFGLRTTGGTEGVGRSTTQAVVVVAITVLVADALLTQIFVLT